MCCTVSWLGVGHARRVPTDGALRARSALRPDRSDTPHTLVGAVFAAARSGNGSIDIPRNVLLPRAWKRLRDDLFCIEWDVKPSVDVDSQSEIRWRLRFCCSNSLRLYNGPTCSGLNHYRTLIGSHTLPVKRAAPTTEIARVPLYLLPSECCIIMSVNFCIARPKYCFILCTPAV